MNTAPAIATDIAWLTARVVAISPDARLLWSAGTPKEGVVDVPDLFAVVIGPSSLIVDGDVTFADELTVPAVEGTIERAAAALRERWPSIEYIYLTPVHAARSRRAARSLSRG